LVTDLLKEGATRYEDSAGGYVTSNWGADRGIPGKPRATDLRALQMKPYGGVITEGTLKALSDMGYDVGNIDPQLLKYLGLISAGTLAGGAAIGRTRSGDDTDVSGAVANELIKPTKEDSDL
jgi:hypothetical protein